MSEINSTERINNTAFRDLLTMLIAGLLGVIVAFMSLEYAKKVTEDERFKEPPPGQIVWTMTWDSDSTSDVDLYLYGPKEDKAISYENKSGEMIDLLRDDRGKDFGIMNVENAYSRGFAAGEYSANIHCYRCDRSEEEVKVEASIARPNPDGKGGIETTLIATATLKIVHHEEKTAIRFSIDDKGNLIAGSVHRTKLRLVPATLLNGTKESGQ